MAFETIKEALESEDGKAALAKAIEDAVTGLKDKNTQLLGKMKDDKAERETMKERLDKIEAEKQAAEDEAAKKSGNMEEVEKRITERYEKQAKEDKERNEKLNSQLNNHVVSEGLTKALVDAGVAKDFMDAATALIKSQHKAEIGDNDGQPFAKFDGQAVDTFVAEWAKEGGKHFIKADNNSGGGSNGANSNGEANAGVKTMTRTDFGKLDATAKAKFSVEGGRLTDDN